MAKPWARVLIKKIGVKGSTRCMMAQVSSLMGAPSSVGRPSAEGSRRRLGERCGVQEVVHGWAHLLSLISN